MNTPPFQPGNIEEENELDLRRLLGVLRDSWWLIAATTLLGGILAGMYLWQASPVYRADALIQIERKQGNMMPMAGMRDLYGYGGGSDSDTEIQIFKSRKVVGAAIDKLNLDIFAAPRYFRWIGEPMARRAGNARLAKPFLGLDQYAWGGENITVSRLSVPDAMRGARLTLRYLGDEHYEIFHGKEKLFTGQVGEPASGGDVGLVVKELRARPGTEFFLGKQRRLGAVKSIQSRIQISELGQRTGVLRVSMEGTDPEETKRIVDALSTEFALQNVERMSAQAQQSLDFLREQLPEVKRDLEAAEEALNQFRARSNTIDISSETEGLLTKLVAIEGRISDLEFKRLEIEHKYTPEHPAYQLLMQQKASLIEEKKKVEKEVGNLPDTQQQILRLMRDVQVKTELYTQLLTKAQELDIARAGTVGNVRVVDSAVADAGPIKPNVRSTMIKALLLGGIIGVVIAFIRVLLHRAIESPDQLEALGLPVYATVPYSQDQAKMARFFAQGGAGSKGAGILAERNPADLSVEALRSLRTSLHFAFMGAAHRHVALTGPSPGVGKSFVAANLAVLLAQAGERVVLIDGDMRKGTLHRYAGIESENGLSELLSGQISLEQSVHKVYGIDLITRGKVPPNPSELLMSEAFKNVLDQLKERYDIVLVDTPPVLAVTDAAVICGQVNATLMVVRFGVNPIDEVRLSLSRLEQANVKVKGALLNGVVKKAGGYYQNAYYQYEYK